MCGDAVDDAPALARAHVAIALGHDAEAAQPGGDLTLVAGGIGGVGDALELARRTLQIVRQNLAWSLAYPVALVPFAAGALVPWLGYRMPPALVPAAMALSSLGVVLSSRRLRRFEPVGDSGTSGGTPPSD
jgi:Cu+-exporting ATPase